MILVQLLRPIEKNLLDFRLHKFLTGLLELNFEFLDSAVCLFLFCLEIKDGIGFNDLLAGFREQEIALYRFFDQHPPNQGISVQKLVENRFMHSIELTEVHGFCGTVSLLAQNNFDVSKC